MTSSTYNAPRHSVTGGDVKKPLRVKRDSSGSATSVKATDEKSRSNVHKTRTYSVVFNEGAFEIKDKRKRA